MPEQILEQFELPHRELHDVAAAHDSPRDDVEVEVGDAQMQRFRHPAAPQQGGGSSFFANAATTAAGVAGGMFLFDGIESLLGGHRGGGFFGGGFGGQPEVIENVTENNFYDDGNSQLSSGGDQDFASGNDFDDANFDSGSFDDDNSWT